MTELKRPASVRELLEQLDRSALVLLCEARQLHVSRANDDCRSSIARSFRGQRDEFLASLRKSDLEVLLSLPIRYGDEVYELPTVHGYSKRELCELAILGFGNTRGLDAPFVLAPEDDEEIEQDEDEVANGVEDEDGVEDEGEEEEEAPDDGETDERETHRFWSYYSDPAKTFSPVELAGQIRCATVRKSDAFHRWIARTSGLELSTVRRKFAGCHGYGNVRRLFDDMWPLQIETAPREMLGSLSASPVLRSPALVRWIADISGVAPQDTDDRLASAVGRTRVATVLPEILENGAIVAPASDSPTSTSDDPLLAPDSSPSLSGSAGSGWSRLRPVRSLFAQLGLHEPEGELTQAEFGALMDALELRGYEVQSSSGQRLTSLHDAVSIDAEVRLRHDAFTGLPASHPAPLGVGGGERDDRNRDRDLDELGDYERAALRLELLTSGGDAADHLEPKVSKMVETATAGLDIRDGERALLRVVASALAATRRDPIVVLTGLVRRLDVEDGEVLLREYASLHAIDQERHAVLADHWAALNRSARPRDRRMRAAAE